jgi:hypothetical protein
MLKKGAAQTLGASETDTVVTKDFRLSGEDSKFLLIRLDTSSVTVATAVTANLQHSWDGGTTWEDLGSGSQVSITGNDSYQIEHDYAAANTSLAWPLARVVVSTGSGDAATVDAVYVSRRL